MTLNLYISPEVQCQSCDALTHYATYERDTNTVEILPRCARHDFVESYSERDLHKCLRRFIQCMLPEYAIVSSIEPCEVEESGYERAEDDVYATYAWRFDYWSRSRNDQIMYVVWSNHDLAYKLLPEVEQASL